MSCSYLASPQQHQQTCNDVYGCCLEEAQLSRSLLASSMAFSLLPPERLLPILTIVVASFVLV